jgi:aliphatic nitrilase
MSSMGGKILKVAAAQLAPVLDRPGGTLERVLGAVAEAAGKGVEFLVFPETFLPYYPYWSFIDPPYRTGAKHLALYEEAVVVPGPECQALSAAARRHKMVIVAGVNERDGGSLYNSQLIFDADGTLALKRRKITPTYHERMIWGQGDGSGLRAVDTAVGRVGALACWEHFNPLARYALMADGEEIHASQFPGSMVGQQFADQIEAAIRHHAAESACFVVNATGWLTPDQIATLAPDEAHRKALSGGCFTAIISPEGQHVIPPLTSGEGLLIADCDMALVTKRKRMMDSAGHYARPELLSLHIDDRPARAVVRSASTPVQETRDGQDDDNDGGNDRPVAVLRHQAG